jgi:hypothetical protein
MIIEDCRKKEGSCKWWGACHACLIQEEEESASTLVASNEDRNVNQSACGGNSHASPRQRGKCEPTRGNRVPDQRSVCRVDYVLHVWRRLAGYHSRRPGDAVGVGRDIAAIDIAAAGLLVGGRRDLDRLVCLRWNSEDGFSGDCSKLDS